MVEKKGEERILVRECKARLGERETLTSPGVRVLSLDGGRMRGVVTMLMLEELEEMTGAKTHQMFDLIVGTSTWDVRGGRCTGRNSRGVWWRGWWGVSSSIRVTTTTWCWRRS